MAGPVRTCLGCGAKLGKEALVRFAMASGELMIDERARQPGRGVYCCRKMSCFEGLLKQRKKLAWALRCQVRDRKGYDLVDRLGLEALFCRMISVDS